MNFGLISNIIGDKMELLNKEEIEEVMSRFEKNNPNPKCELDWKSPYTLLVSVVLSAQSTDKSVNENTKKLYEVADTPEKMIAFCGGLQRYSPVDSFALPEPWDMPGYADQVIMAAGAFVQGASIELSADGPMRPPYNVYLQGGLTFEHALLGIMGAAQAIENL